jgi:cell fate regulator YaaT (PSP1 superfamily)
MPDSYIVRYGATRTVAEFSFKGPPDLNRNDAVLVRSKRGVEWGEVLCPATDRTREYMGGDGQVGRILRSADSEAWTKLDETRLREREVFFGGKEVIREHKLNMNLVDVECLFGGERIVFYYLAEQRVDFRELVKSLARRFHSRIEMRQIGVRDEARLLADYGDCGKPVCCGTHLREMPPVSMKMAKLQKATLDPNKISGRCGRLKCCLRYEYDTYEEHHRELPNNGSTVITKQGQGFVVAREILAKKLLVQHESGKRVMVDLADIVTVVSSGKKGGSSDRKGSRSKGRGDSSQGSKPPASSESATATAPPESPSASTPESKADEN